MRILILVATHGIALGIGFALGIYLLPILAEPPPPAASEMRAAQALSQHQGVFRRDLPGSDALHWGEGTVHVGAQAIALDGRLSPGPAYRLYLSPEFVDDEASFLEVRPRMAAIGDIRTFTNFLLPVPAGVDVDDYDTVVVWCEAFGQFITAARYAPGGG